MANKTTISNLNGFSWTSLLLFSLFMGCQKNEKSGFELMAIGDLPYHLPEDFTRFDRLIDNLNEYRPNLTLHVGDIKSGSSPCNDEYYKKILSYFQKFEHPLIYTPGDNEWTDCHREVAGNYNPEERLDKLRQLFFSKSQSQGKPLPLKTQNQFEGFEKFVENAYWETKQVSFGTFHVIGSNNNLKLNSAALNDEFYEREMANLFWLDHIFESAKSLDHHGVVLVLHAALNFNDSGNTNGHQSFVSSLREKTMAYQNPVLLVYGDHHQFLVHKPFRGRDGKVLTNFTAVQVFGDRDMHAVRIRVNPENPGLFSINPHYVAGN
ncbi:MAG: metallophosphoesterase [Cyclobacteriaceae bacterium]